MACKLSEKQIIALAKYVTSALENAKPETLNPNFTMDLMKNLYDSIVAKTGDAVNALDYIQHIPTSILAVSGANPEYFTKLVGVGVDINKLTLTMKEFEDVDNVKKAMTGNVKLEEIKNEIVNNELPDSGVIPTDRYNEIEAADATLKKEGKFKAKPETGFATFLQEAKNYDGVKKEDNIPDNDPLKVLHFRVVRMLNTMLSEKNLATADNLKLNNVKGIYYKLVDFNEIPEDNMYLEHKKYYENKSRGDKGVALILSDKNGNTLYFDNEGNISSKEDGGKMIYTSMRKPFVNDIYNVQKPAEIAKRTGRDLAEVEKQRSYEIQILNKAREYAKNPNNASKPLLFSITQGSNGYILEDYRKQVQLSNLSFPTGFAPFISTENVGMMIKGGVYFQPDSGKNYPVLLRRPKFENIKGLTEGMIIVLYDNKLSNSEKIAIIKQFVFSNSTAIYEENGKLFVKQKGEAFEIDNSTKDETSKKIAANLNGQIVNINGDLLNRTISIPVIENGKLSLSESSYNKFLAENFYTFLQPNADKSIVSLNAYNIIKPTETVLNTLLKQETQAAGVKEQVQELFNSNPELQSIGTPEQYSQYLNTVFPDSLRKGQIFISNRSTPTKNVEDLFKDERRGISYFSATSEYYSSLPYRVYAVLDVRNVADMGSGIVSLDKPLIELYKKEGFDSGTALKIGTHTDERKGPDYFKLGDFPFLKDMAKPTSEELKNYTLEYKKSTPSDAVEDYEFVVFEPKQVHILGSKQDVEGFKTFISKPAQQTAAPVTLENAVDTSKPVSKDDIFKALNALKRNTLNRSNTLINDNVTESQIAAAKEWYDNSPLAKFAPYEVMFNIVNSDAWADFTAAGIRLYAGSTYADLYHEGWHAFSQLFLTVDQKKELYNEVRKTQPSLKNATDLQVEEHLAEDFRKYALAKGENIKSGSPVRNTLFRKIWNFLKSLFTGQTISDVLSDYDSVPAVRELYEKLYVGNLNEYRPSINNMMFTGLNLGITANANDAEQVLNYNDSLVVSDSIDSIMSNMLQDERNLGGVSLIFENEAAKNWLYLAVKNDFKEIIKSIQEKIKDQPEEAVQKELNDIKILQIAVDNWDGVLKFHKKKSVLLDFKQKVSDETAVDIDSNKDTETQKTSDSELEKSEAQLQEEYGKNVFESKGNEKSTREIASTETTYLIGSLHAYDKNGKRIANRFGIDKLADPSRTWGIVLNAIEGAVDDQDMYAKLLLASKIYPELKELANLLGDPSDQVTADSAGKVKLWTKFYRDFSLSRIPIFNLKVDVNVNGEIKFQEIQPNFSAVNKMMLDNYGAINNNYTNSNNKDGVHKTDVVKVLKDFKEITSREEAYDFLKAIGIELTNNQAIKEKLGYSLAEVKEIRAEFEKLKSLIDKGAKPLEIIYRNVPKSVITVLNIEAQYSGRFNNNARYNVNDDVVYDISLNNTISKLFKEFNDFRKNYQEIISQPHMRHLDVRNNPNAKYSIWLHSLFNLDETDLTSFTQRKNIAAYGKVVKNTIGLINIDGVKDETVGYGIKTTNLDPASKFLMDMHMLLTSGVQELMRHGDKSSAYGVRLGQLYTKFNDSKKTSHLFIDPNYFSTEAGHNAGVELILPKIAAELERIAILKEGNMPIIPGFNDSPTARGFSLTMFDDMLSVKTKEELVALANSSDSLSVITPELKQKISNELKSYFQGVVKENTDLYNEYKVMDSKVKNMIKLPVGSSKTTEEVAIEAYTYNAMLYNMESIALLYGDLALYNHAKDEFHKRNSSIGSTGRDFRASDSFYAFMATKNRLYAQSLGITDSKYQFNGILNTAVFQDSNVAMPSEMFEEYVNAYIESSKLNGRTVTKEQAEKALKGYKEINEGDGQGWVTFDSYRLLKIAEGDWSDSQEELYKKIVNKEEISEADTLEFFPPYKVQYSGPLQSNKLQIQAFHKFSLAPLIPSVIKGTNMEILHNNMTRQNVDYGLFQSGSKLASYTKDGSFDKLYTGENRQVKEWAEGEPEYTKNPVFIQYLKNQVDIAPTFKGNSIFSTQLRKLIINDIFKNGIAVNSKMGDLVANFESLLDKLQENKTKDLLKEIGWNSLADANDVAKLPNLLKFVKKELTRQDLADNIIDFLDINPDGSIKYDLSLSLHADKIEKLLNAIVIKRLVKQKFNGEGLIQLASTGFENATEEQKNKYGASDLPTYHPGKDGKTTAMKVKIALQGNFKKLLNLSDVKKLSEKESISPLEALNKLIKDDAWMAKNNKLVTMVGVRIPVQGLNSMEFMEVYEFLPEEAGNAIIVPSELVTKSGGDFDIDKLTIFMPNISESTKYNTSSKLLSKLQKENPDLDFSKNNVDILIDANKNGQEVYEFNLDDQKVFNILKKNAEETLPYYLNSENTKGIENKIIENIREILEQPESFASLVTPNDTNLVNNQIVEELAKLNIHGYSGKIAGQKGISPTRVLEQRFNYAKMEENNIGKKMLGIGAVDNSYSSIFKRIGAHMGDQYTFYRVDKKGNVTPQVRDIRMLLEHNTMTVGGKKVISLSDIETKTGVKVSDLISQLMNGWVDVAKDAWVFNINGNNIAGPVLLFMLEAGVDYETAVYLTTQPLVVDYVKEVYKQMSPFNTQESQEPIKITMGLAKYKAKVNMLKKFGYFDNAYNPKSTDLYKTILELAGNKQFTLEQLKNSVVTKDRTSNEALAAFAHFLELEETAKTLTNAKLKVNVDTAPSKSIVAAKKRLLDIAELSDYEAMPLVNKIFTDSPIKSFLIQGLQIKLFSPLMPLRFNDVVTDNIIKYIKDGNLIRTKFNGDIDRFSDSYKNDLVAYIFQNVIKGINFKKLTEYKGLNIKPLTVKNVLLKAGAFVKDGNLYLDLDQLKHDFETNAFAGQDVEGRPSSYKELGLHTLPAVYFKSIGNKDQQFQEYVKFIIEREILRSITKGSEEDLAKRALERSFNFYHNYKSKDSIANQLFTLKEDYAKGFVSEYSAFFDNILNKKKTKGDFQQLGLRTNKADSNLTNAIVENLIRLADPSTKKVSDVAENNRISRFFNRLIVSEVLRSGLTKTSTTIISVIPNDVIANILSSYTKEFVSMLKENPDLINSYNNLFAINAGVEFKNYVNYNSAKPNTNKLDEYLSSVENSELLSLINYANLKETLNNNQDKLFLFGNNANGITESKETGVFQSASNTLAVPLKQKGGVSKTALWTDATYESNIQAINDALDAAEVQKQNGATLVIPSNGLNMIDGVNILANAPKTYEYLVGELYKRFNFVTPGAETNLGFRTVVQENQDITDAEVNDILNKKFEESKKCNQ